MTKSQNKQAFNTAAAQNKTAAANAQSTYQSAQQDIGDYENELSRFAAENPYVLGGEYETAQNQELASTAAGGSQAAQQAAQAAAVRSGMNPQAAIAAGTAAQEENTRQQLGDVANANQSRIAQEAKYKQDVLGASAEPASLEAQLTAQQLGAQGNTLGQETETAKQPSFWQELGQGLVQAGSSFAGGYGAGLAKCWIAARIYGGWNAREVALIRLWLTHEVSRWRGGWLFLWLYDRYGQRIAERWMPKSPRLTRAMEKLFGWCFLEAQVWTTTHRGLEILTSYDEMRRVHGYVSGREAPRSWLDWATLHAGEER